MKVLGAIAGALGTAFVALCCLGWAPALGLLGAAGLGFLATDAILFPLLAVFLLVLYVSVRALSRSHRGAG